MKNPIPQPTQDQQPASPPAQAPVALLAQPGPSESYLRHRRQTIWQIWVPLGIFCLMILAMAVGIVLTAIPGGTSLDIARWSYVSQVWLVVPLLLVAILILLIIAGLVYLMARLLKVLPVYTRLAQAYAHLASVMVKVWADRIASPVIKIQGAWAGWQTLRRRLFG